MTKQTSLTLKGAWGFTLNIGLILQVGKEERLTAEQSGKYNEGIPSISVVVDTDWSSEHISTRIMPTLVLE